MPAPSPVPLVAIVLGIGVLGIGIAFNATSANADTSGHALAQRFADGAAEETARRKEAAEAKRRAAEEAEMLARARAEAAERKAAADKARAEEEAREAQLIAEEERAEKARLAEAQRLEREKFIAEQIQAEEERQRAEAARIAEEKRIADEKRIAEEKRAAEEKKQRLAEEQRIAREAYVAEQKRVEEERERAESARLAEEKRLAEDKQRAEELRAAEEKRLAEERRLAEEDRRAEQRRLELAAEHEAAHARREERMRRIEQERIERERMAARSPEPDLTRVKTQMGLGAPPPRDTAAEETLAETETDVAPAAVASTRSATPPERVTVLLVMEPGKTGIRRFGTKTADPVLCSGPTCWIAAGEDRAAREVSRAFALGPANTMGPRAAACNKHLSCVFRDIDLDGASATIQPIDLRVLRHDRREPLRLEADRSCRLASGKLVCDKIFVSRSWRAWVIDEALARKAGPAALEAAMRNGLRPGPSAALGSSHF